MIDMKLRTLLTAGMAALLIVSCTKEPVSATDPLPLPSGAEAGKDLSIKPGDNFYDYCNGTWLKNTPIPATSAVGGIYEQARRPPRRLSTPKRPASPSPRPRRRPSSPLES